MDNKKLKDIETANIELLDIISDQVLEKIQNGIPGWESTMPSKVATAIKEERLFNYKEPQQKVKSNVSG